jgi:hypothetical protein
MAAPTYSEDLTDIDMAQSTTGWSAFGGGGAGLGTGADFAIQSTLAIDKQITAADKGMMHNDATVSLGASDHIFGWIFAATPGICDIVANHGGYMAIGTDTSNFNKYAMFGSDTRPEGGNKPWVARYSTSTPSPGAQVGTPGATPTYFGGGLNTTATAKGANLGLDAFRFGTGAYITAGDGTTPATMDGFATQDEASANKWGILFRQEGAYKWQGRFAVGQNNAGTATAAHFDDVESAAVFILDTPHSQTDFTQWIIDHASTIFNCSNKSFFTLGTNNPGKIVINNASASSTGWASCVWNDFGAIQGHVNVPYTTCSMNRTDQIDQNAGTFSDCTIDSNTATSAILMDNPSLVTDCTFISDGTGHAGRIRPTGAGPFNFNWDGNSDSGYAATDGSTGNETLLIDPVTASADITLTLTNGASTPTIMEAAGYTGTFTLVTSSATTTVTVLDARDNSFIENARVLVTAGATGNLPDGDSVTITRSGSTASVSHTGHGLLTGQKVMIKGADQNEYNCVAAITNVTTNAYDYTVTGTPTTPATGTITSTAVIIDGLTNASGVISDTRSYSANQSIGSESKVAKASSSPYFAASPALSGTINTSSGLSLTVQLVLDE